MQNILQNPKKSFSLAKVTFKWMVQCHKGAIINPRQTDVHMMKKGYRICIPTIQIIHYEQGLSL